MKKSSKVRREGYEYKNGMKIRIVRFLSFLVWFLPDIVYFVLLYGVWNVDRTTSLVLPGFLGGALIGFTLFFAVGSTVPEAFQFRFSWKVIGIPLAVGGILMGASLAITLSPDFVARFDETAISFYFLLWMSVPVLLLAYAFLRPLLKRCFLQNGVKKQQYRMLQRGGLSTLWYRNVKKVCAIGWLYYANIVFTILFATAFLLLAVVGWWKPMLTVSAVLLAADFACGSVMLFVCGCRTGFSLTKGKNGSFGAVPLTAFCVFLLWIAVEIIRRWMQCL